MNSHDSNVKILCTDVIPVLAIDHPYLMNALLAAAALNFSRTDPANSEWAKAHRQYFDAAVVDQRQRCWLRGLASIRASPPCDRTACPFINESGLLVPIVNCQPSLSEHRAMCIVAQYRRPCLHLLKSAEDGAPDDDALAAYQFTLGLVNVVVEVIESSEDVAKVRRLISAFGALAPPQFKQLVKDDSVKLSSF